MATLINSVLSKSISAIFWKITRQKRKNIAELTIKLWCKIAAFFTFHCPTTGTCLILNTFTLDWKVISIKHNCVFYFAENHGWLDELHVVGRRSWCCGPHIRADQARYLRRTEELGPRFRQLHGYWNRIA